MATRRDFDKALQLAVHTFGERAREPVREWWSFATELIASVQAAVVGDDEPGLTDEQRRVLDGIRASSLAMNALEQLAAMPKLPSAN
jgi:hypothetical protein